MGDLPREVCEWAASQPDPERALARLLDGGVEIMRRAEPLWIEQGLRLEDAPFELGVVPQTGQAVVRTPDRREWWTLSPGAGEVLRCRFAGGRSSWTLFRDGQEVGEAEGPPLEAGLN